jgi:hypothetical protein
LTIPTGDYVESPTPIALTSAGTDGSLDVFNPSVAGNDTMFMVVHQEATSHKSADARTLTAYQLISSVDGKVVQDSTLTPDGAREKTPFVAAGPPHQFLVVYERNAQSDAHQRVCARFVTY